jgi:hypothetical protein
MKKYILGVSIIVAFMAATPLFAADSFYLYWEWNPGLAGAVITGVNGWVDTSGVIEGIPNAEYLFFESGAGYCGSHTAYIYRVSTAGDPDQYPGNPGHDGPVETRTFTFVSSHPLGTYSSGHDNGFYVDRTGIYYGASDNPRDGCNGWTTVAGGAIQHWDFNWNLIGCSVSTAAPTGVWRHQSQTLARNPKTGQWWVGLADRQIYRWGGSSWDVQGTYPNLGGDHHDGMVIINNSLFISDMTSDTIIQYRLDPNTGDLIDHITSDPNSPYKKFSYSAGPDVEGMGFGPNRHIWIAGYNSKTIYEIGGGELQQQMNPIPPIPTLSNWGLIIFGIVLLGFISWVFLKRRKVIGVRS